MVQLYLYNICYLLGIIIQTYRLVARLVAKDAKDTVARLLENQTSAENLMTFDGDNPSQRHVTGNADFLFWCVRDVEVCSPTTSLVGRRLAVKGRGLRPNRGRGVLVVASRAGHPDGGGDGGVGYYEEPTYKYYNSEGEDSGGVDSGGVVSGGVGHTVVDSGGVGPGGSEWVLSPGSVGVTGKQGPPGRKHCPPEITQLSPSSAFGTSFMISFAKGGQIRMIGKYRKL